MSKPIPKSLHTVTVLVRVARQLARYEIGRSWEYAVDLAATILGWGLCPDPHGLKAAALKQLEGAK